MKFSLLISGFRNANWKRLLLWMLIAVLCVMAIALGYRGYMNYRGYCWEEGRYLTTQEKIRRTVEDVLKKYPPNILPMESIMVDGKIIQVPRSIEDFEKREPGRSWTMVKPQFPIPYKDVDDFLRANPDCCEVRSAMTFDGPEGRVATFFDRLAGREFDFIKVRYLVKYMENGKEKLTQTSYYAGLSNCGRPTR